MADLLVSDRGFKRTPPIDCLDGTHVVVRESSNAEGPQLTMEFVGGEGIRAWGCIVNLDIPQAETLIAGIRAVIDNHYQMGAKQ